jgi:hypothetical protein
MNRPGGSANPLEPLVGEELSAVVFVRDYIQLQFDGPSLTLINDPIVLADGTKYQPTTAGFRDAICGRIGQRVKAAHTTEGQEIRIDFADGSTICLSLKPEDYNFGPEAAILHHGEDTWVWSLHA